MLKPDDFGAHKRHGSTFNLCRGLGDTILLLIFLGIQGIYEKDTPIYS